MLAGMRDARLPIAPAMAGVMAAIVMLGLAPTAFSRQSAPLRTALTFYAPFDGGATAASALGDPELYSAPSRKEAASATRGLADGVQIVRGEGRHGDALRLRLKSSPFVFFKGAGNIAYGPRNWSGTISFWMNLDPDEDLVPGYSDPLIVTPRSWNDAALFVDFTRDDVPRRFRFAAFADRDVWDPARREWEAVPVAERPMVEITGKRFARGKWTHVAWTWERFNTGRADGTLTCYLDGLPAGTLANRRQTFTWRPADVSIALGVEFNGLMDELAIFNRALTRQEMELLGGAGGRQIATLPP
jgi:Concanavalin A-like lectin/glucanases superfamily